MKRRSGSAVARGKLALADLPNLTTAELRHHWQRLHGHAPPPRLSPDLLRRGIAYKQQEATHGGLPSALQRRLASIATMVDGSGSVAPAAVRLKPGATLVRDWHGDTYTVLVRDNGFEMRGQRFSSLTEIAKHITGAAWSGPRFFGQHRKPRAKAGVSHVGAAPDQQAAQP